MIQKLQRKYALSEQGARDLIKGCIACVLQNLSFLFPVGLLYLLVGELLGGTDFQGAVRRAMDVLETLIDLEKDEIEKNKGIRIEKFLDVLKH